MKVPLQGEQLPSGSIEVKQIQHFYNPICKKTYQALPKIYGDRRKNYMTIEKEHFNYCERCLSPLQQQKEKQTNYKKIQYNFQDCRRLSQPKRSLCNKKYCTCHKIKNIQEKKVAKKAKVSNHRTIILPKIQSKQIVLQDIQSKYKVKTQISQRNLSNFGLESLNYLTKAEKCKESYQYNNHNTQIQDKYYYKQYKNHLSSQQNSKKYNFNFDTIHTNRITQKDNMDSIQEISQIQTINQVLNKKKKNMKLVNTLQYYTQRNKIDSNVLQMKINQKSTNSLDTNILGEATQQTVQQQNLQSIKIQKLKNCRDIEAFNNVQFNSNRANSVIATSDISQNPKKINTIFHNNIERQKSLQKLGLQSQLQIKSVLSNGSFRIPQQNQYKSYLVSYKYLGSGFDMIKLFQSPSFKIQRQNNYVYFGEIKDEQRHGFGLLVTQKQIFQGEFEHNLKKKGCQRNIDGIFSGQFVNGQRCGFGRFKWNNGELFQGNWKQGTKNGYGVWKSPKGDQYQGQWLLNRQHGFGIYKHKASIYQGQFKNFLKHGKGKQQFTSGDIYQGEYKEGRPYGSGKYRWAQGDQYIGDFVKGMRQGKGKWIQSSGNSYEGQFFNDFKHGQGKQININGSIFQGQFEQGVRIKGTIRYTDVTKINLQ